MNANQLIAAATVKCTSDGYTSYPALCVLLENKLRQACAEIAMFKGENATPQRGASFLHSLPKSDLYSIARQCMEQMHADEVRDLLRTHFAEYLIVEVKP